MTVVGNNPRVAVLALADTTQQQVHVCTSHGGNRLSDGGELRPDGRRSENSCRRVLAWKRHLHAVPLAEISEVIGLNASARDRDHPPDVLCSAHEASHRRSRAPSHARRCGYDWRCSECCRTR